MKIKFVVISSDSSKSEKHCYYNDIDTINNLHFKKRKSRKGMI